MGLFGKSKDIIPSRIWRSKAETLKGMSVEAMKEMRAGRNVLIVTFFDSTFEEVRSFLTQNGIPFDTFSDGTLQDGGTIFLLPPARLDLSPLPGIKHLALVLFYGRYPLQSREEVVAGKLPPEGQRLYCASLEDQLFRHFGGNGVKSLMETLGMKDDEFVEHRMIDKSIARAQEKLAGVVRNEIKAKSEEEWFQKNAIKG